MLLILKWVCLLPVLTQTDTLRQSNLHHHCNESTLAINPSQLSMDIHDFILYGNSIFCHDNAVGDAGSFTPMHLYIIVVMILKQSFKVQTMTLFWFLCLFE